MQISVHQSFKSTAFKSFSLAFLLAICLSLPAKLCAQNTNCEQRFSEIEAQIIKLDFVQQKEIFDLLALWEQQCGESEFSQRIMLILNIGLGKATEEQIDRYLKRFGRSFLYRLEHEGKADPAKLSDRKIEKLYYAPLRCKLDSWAANLAEEQMSIGGLSEYKLATLRLFAGDTESILPFWDWKDIYYEYFHPLFFRLGNYTSLGHVNRAFPNSFRFDLGIKAQIVREWGAWFGINIIPLNKKLNYQVNIRAVNFNTEASTIFQMGLGPRYVKRINKKNSFSISSGFMYQNIDTDIKKYSLRHDSDTSDFVVASLVLPVNIEIGFDGEHLDWGLFGAYSLSWFALDPRLRTRFNPHALSLGLYIRL